MGMCGVQSVSAGSRDGTVHEIHGWVKKKQKCNRFIINLAPLLTILIAWVSPNFQNIPTATHGTIAFGTTGRGCCHNALAR